MILKLVQSTLMLAALTAAVSAAEPGLVAHYTFDEGAGGKWGQSPSFADENGDCPPFSPGFSDVALPGCAAIIDCPRRPRRAGKNRTGASLPWTSAKRRP